VVALLGLHSPGATGAGAVTAVVSGSFTTAMTFGDTGFRMPCNTVDADHTCPPRIVPTPPPTGKLSPPFTPYGDVGTTAFTATSCVDPGACTLTLGFSLHGYCGLAAGAGTGGLIDSGGVAHSLRFTFTVTGTAMVFRGHAVNEDTDEVGDLYAALHVEPDTDDCLTGTARTFDFTGDIALVYPKPTP
jgi:hypothetical protein